MNLTETLRIAFAIIAIAFQSDFDFELELARARLRILDTATAKKAETPVPKPPIAPMPPAIPDDLPDEAVPKPEPEPAKPAAYKKTVVYFYTQDRCEPCRLLSADFQRHINAGDCPVEVIYSQTPNIPLNGVPVVHWNGTNGKGYLLRGNQGYATWLEGWKITNAEDYTKFVEWRKQSTAPASRHATARPAVPKTPIGPKPAARQFNQYMPQWYWPKNQDLGSHLQYSHGINTGGLSQDQMEMMHDNLHNSAPQSRRSRRGR